MQCSNLSRYALKLNEQEKELLLETMKNYNAVANFIAQKAFGLKLANKYELQKLSYRDIRERFNLSAQFTIRVISKVVEAYKRDKSGQPHFRLNGAIQYDQRNLSWKGIDRVSLITLNGRIKLQTRIGEYQRSRADRLRGQADLLYLRGVFYLVAVVDAPEESQYDPEGTLGVDLGIENLATDSDGEVFSGKRVEKTRQRYSKLRASLQRAKGTSRHRSAQRKLKDVSGRERRFKKDTNPECHCVDKKNRPTRDTFRCIRCGLEAMADHIAARNIASRARFNEPIVAPLFSAVTISLPSSGGRS